MRIEPSHEVRPPSMSSLWWPVLLGGVASSYVALLLVGVTPFLGV